MNDIDDLDLISKTKEIYSSVALALASYKPGNKEEAVMMEVSERRKQMRNVIDCIDLFLSQI